MAQTAKFTPGPWVEGDGLTIWASGRKIVACPAVSLNDPTDEERANARLVKASPALFQSLRNIVTLFEGDLERGAPAQLAAAREALADAIGSER